MTTRPPAFHIAQSLGAREKQEDDFGVSLKRGSTIPYLVVVADGMGGQAGGDVASALAVRRFLAAFEADPPQRPEETPARLRAALEATNLALVDEVADRPELEGMGTTLVALADTGAGVFHISVGDSLLWRLHGDQLRRINDDHSMRSIFRRMAADGEMTAEQAERHPHRHRLRAAVGDPSLDLVDCPDVPISADDDLVLILASDGIETLDETEIATLVAGAGGDARHAVEALLAAIAEKGAPRQDNSTVCVWHVGPGAGGPVPIATRSRWSVLLAAAALTFAGLAAVAAWLFLARGPAEMDAKHVPARAAPPPRAARPVAPPVPPHAVAVEGPSASALAEPAPAPLLPPRAEPAKSRAKAPVAAIELKPIPTAPKSDELPPAQPAPFLKPLPIKPATAPLPTASNPPPVASRAGHHD